MQPTVTDRVAWSVCQPFSLCVTIMNLAEMAKPIEMPLGLWIQVSTEGPCEGSRLLYAKGNFQGRGEGVAHC